MSAQAGALCRSRGHPRAGALGMCRGPSSRVRQSNAWNEMGAVLQRWCVMAVKLRPSSLNRRSPLV